MKIAAYLFVCCLFFFGCSYDDSPYNGPWSIKGRVLWNGSGEVVANAEVLLLDPTVPFGQNDVLLITDEEGRYDYSSTEYQKEIRFDATLDGRQFPVAFMSEAYPNEGVINHVKPEMNQDIYLQAVGSLDVMITLGSNSMPHEAVMSVFAETVDSVQVLLFDINERIVLDEYRYFKVDHYGLSKVQLVL